MHLIVLYISIHAGPSLPPEHTISSIFAYSEMECSLLCGQKSTCVGFNYRSKSKHSAVNCQLSNKTQESKEYGDDDAWIFYQDLNVSKH